MLDAEETTRVMRHEGKNRGRGLPSSIIWDITYACPLRCVHCYTESGRRPSRQLSASDVLRVAEIVVRMGIKAVFLSGGEPLIVKGLTAAIELWASESIAVYLFTSGWSNDPNILTELAPRLAATHVSIDGASASVHDRIRRRAGSFERAASALAALDAASAAQRAARKPRLQFGIDCTLIQSNLDQVDAIVSEFPKRYPELTFVNFGAAVPSGVASTADFAERELLTESQLGELRRAARRWQPANKDLLVSFSDQRNLQMHPDDIEAGTASVDTMLIEPDGEVRAMPIYEGTVGNLLTDSPSELWHRAQTRWRDPFVVAQLAPARTRVEWAAATRAIDARFACATDRDRIQRHLTVLA